MLPRPPSIATRAVTANAGGTIASEQMVEVLTDQACSIGYGVSGQETTGMLRAALERLALAGPSFQAKLTLATGSATAEVREAATLAIELLRDRSFRLPRAP